VLLGGCGLTESLDGYGGGTPGPVDAGVDQGNAGSAGDASTSDSGGSAGDSSVEDSHIDAPQEGSEDTSEPDVSADAEAGLDATQDISEDSLVDVSEDAPVQETGPDATQDSSTCLATQKLCSGGCVEVTDPAYGCGSTGCTPCPTPEHASAVCQGTTCSGTCLAGWANCNNSMSDGCEIDTNSDVQHCGACERPCSTYRVKGALSLSCSLGLCDTSDCNASWTNVSMPPAPEPDDGCETQI